jgi:predicted nucleic acid-binding protein
VAERRFFDTNVLVYAHGADEPQKKKTARKLLATHLGDQTAVFSTQVLEEYFVAATRLGLLAELVQQHVATYAQANVVQVTTELILAAIDLHRLHKLSFWEAVSGPQCRRRAGDPCWTRSIATRGAPNC